MKLVVLGSGGSQPTPKVGCDCRTCQVARLEMRRDPRSRHVRSGPSLWLPDHGILIDTPEESSLRMDLRILALTSAAAAIMTFAQTTSPYSLVTQIKCKPGKTAECEEYLNKTLHKSM